MSQAVDGPGNQACVVMRVALDWRVARTSCEMAGGELEAMFCGTLVHATNEEHLKICANRVLGVGKNGEVSKWGCQAGNWPRNRVLPGTGQEER